VRRRNLPVHSLALGPADRAGELRLTVVLPADQAAVVRMANQLRKMVDVIEVGVAREDQVLGREHALIRVRVTPATLAALLDVLALYQGVVLEEHPTNVIVEATGTGPFMTSLLRALEPFEILEVSRGGSLAVSRTPVPAAPAAPRSGGSHSRSPRAIPV
jgi:acetolactate synthase-1/3 small subunit